MMRLFLTWTTLILAIWRVDGTRMRTRTCADGSNRSVRFWVGASGAGGVNIIDRSTNKTCSEYFMGNLTKYVASISSLGFEVWTLSSRENAPHVQYNDGTDFDEGLKNCISSIRNSFPHIQIGLCGTTDTSSLALATSNPSGYVSALRNFTEGVGFAVDEIWTDMEIKYLSDAQRIGANQMHKLSQQIWPTYRYAGCEYRDAPYFAENCSDFVAAAPGVVVQAANTYWSTSVSSGWYGGFEKLVDEEIRNIGASNVGVLSPAICPDCATGDDADNNLTQAELYERMDILCARGIRDLSGFTLFEITQRQNDGSKYMEAFRYFKSGKV